MQCWENSRSYHSALVLYLLAQSQIQPLSTPDPHLTWSTLESSDGPRPCVWSVSARSPLPWLQPPWPPGRSSSRLGGVLPQGCCPLLFLLCWNVLPGRPRGLLLPPPLGLTKCLLLSEAFPVSPLRKPTPSTPLRSPPTPQRFGSRGLLANYLFYSSFLSRQPSPVRM